MQALTEMVPELFIKGCCTGREGTWDTQEAQEAAATPCPGGGQYCGAWGRAVCLEQRPHDRLLLDGGGHLGSEAGRGWNDLNPGLPLSKPT